MREKPMPSVNHQSRKNLHSPSYTLKVLMEALKRELGDEYNKLKSKNNTGWPKKVCHYQMIKNRIKLY